MTTQEAEDQERIDSLLKSYFKEVREDEFKEQMRLVKKEMEQTDGA